MVQLIVYGRVGKITALGMNDQWCFLDLAYHKSPMPVELVEEQASPRLLKTHFPWQFIPASILHSKCKVNKTSSSFASAVKLKAPR
jgi:Sulfotransferase domain